MLRNSDLIDGWFDLIGWEQTIESQGIIIGNSLTSSASGLHYQQAHPLLTLSNLEKIAPDFKNAVYDDWDNATLYLAGKVLKHNSIIYKALRNSINAQPDVSPLDWEQFNSFSEWLERKTKGSILKSARQFITNKSLESNSRGILLNTAIFDGKGRVSDVIGGTDSIVGFELVPARSKGVVVKLEKIGLQFNGTGSFNIYILHSSMAVPYKTIAVTISDAKSFNWIIPSEDIYLPYIGDNSIGGSWYVVYDETELPANTKAINSAVDFSQGPCTSCSRVQKINWDTRSKFIDVYPFKAPTPIDWEISDSIYTLDVNYGLNLELSILCDLTDFMVEQRNLFIDILHKQLAVDMLREMAFNSNSKINRTTLGVSKQEILYEIDGDSTSEKKSGLQYELNNAYKSADLNTRGINKVCLPCKKKGVRYKSI